MKSLFKFLLAGMLVFGLTSGVNAEEWEIREIENPIRVSFQAPSGFNIVGKYDGKYGILNDYFNSKLNLPFAIRFLVSVQDELELKHYPGRYPFDDIGEKGRAVYTQGLDYKVVTLDNGHKAMIAINRKYELMYMDYDHVASLRVYSSGHVIEIKIGSARKLSDDELRLAYKILMTLDF